jgi:hypothetical protein
MKNFFSLLILLLTGSIFANDPTIRCFGELKTKWEYIDMNVFTAQVKYGARYDYENLEVVAELKAKYALCVYYDNILFDIERAYFTYAINDYLSATVGRDNLKEIFESKVQYGSKFNGAAIGLDFARLSMKTAAFAPGIGGYYAGCGQVQVQPLDFPLQIAYSLTYWNSDEDNADPYRISQVSAKVLPLKSLPLFLAGGWLINDRAKKEATAYYLAVEYGNPYPQKKGEWQISTSFKKIELNAIPFIDRTGIIKASSGTGISIEGIYSASDQLSFKGRVEVANVDQNAKERLEFYEVAATCKF